MTTYNYQTQSWESGINGKTVRLAHLKEELELLQSPEGPAFFAWTKKKGDTMTIQEAIRAIQIQIQEIQS